MRGLGPLTIALCSLGAAIHAQDAGHAQEADTSASQPTSLPSSSSAYLAMLAGYTAPAKSLGTTGSGFTGSAILGRQFSSHFSIEANLQSSTFETGTQGGTDFYQNGATLDLVYQLRDRHADLFTPFVLAGAGAVYDDFYPNSRDHVAWVAEAGIGVVSQPLFSVGVRLRADARYVHDSVEGGHAEKRFMAGIEIPLGRRETQIVYLPGKTQIREVIREVVRPSIEPVERAHVQRCENALPGAQVDAQGCMVANQTIAMKGVNFNFNKATLTANAETVLELASHAFSGQPTLKVEVEGHTDSVGSAAANLKLSQERAAAVRGFLIANGVQPDQLVARGYGKTRPLVSPERDDRDRERNRRVELRVVAH